MLHVDSRVSPRWSWTPRGSATGAPWGVSCGRGPGSSPVQAASPAPPCERQGPVSPVLWCLWQELDLRFQAQPPELCCPPGVFLHVMDLSPRPGAPASLVHSVSVVALPWQVASVSSVAGHPESRDLESSVVTRGVCGRSTGPKGVLDGPRGPRGPLVALKS